MYKFDSFFSDTSINIEVESDKGVYLLLLVIIHKYLFILNNAEKEYVVTITNTPDKTFKAWRVTRGHQNLYLPKTQ